jgi:chromate transport protein ChrA
VLAVVVALLLGTIFRLSSEVIKTPLARVLALGAFCFAALFPTTSTWIVVAAGLVGVIVYRDSR